MQAAAGHVRIGQQAIDAGQSFQVTQERPRIERMHQPSQRRSERKLVAVAELVDLGDASLRIARIRAAPVADLLRCGEFRNRLRKRLRVQEIVDDDVRERRRIGIARGIGLQARDVLGQPFEQHRLSAGSGARR